MSKDSFVIYKSWASMMAELPDEELAELTRAVMCHQIGEEFTINNPVVKAIFDMFRSQFDKDDEKYEEVCQRRSENGKKGGRPKVEEKAKESKCFSEKANESKSFFEKAKKADNESDNDNENDTDLRVVDLPAGRQPAFHLVKRLPAAVKIERRAQLCPAGLAVDGFRLDRHDGELVGGDDLVADIALHVYFFIRIIFSNIINNLF